MATARGKMSTGETVRYVAADGTVGLGEVITVHSATLLDLRAVNVAGAPVIYQVERDDAGNVLNTWKPLDAEKTPEGGE